MQDDQQWFLQILDWNPASENTTFEKRGEKWKKK